MDTTPNHFLSTRSLTQASIFQLLDKAQFYLLDPPPTSLLQGKIIANLFFEHSTRTRCSFEIAAQKLGAYVLNFDTKSASIQKGETLFDTVDNLMAMGVNIFVIRHPEEMFPAQIAEHLKERACVINAGDGMHEHPTQAMLDILTIHRHKKDFSKLSIAILGDIRHSRVARSLCFALETLGVADIRLVGPASLLPTEVTSKQTHCHTQLIPGIQDADVVVALRIQRERHIANANGGSFVPGLNEDDFHHYIEHYQLTQAALRHAKPDAIVMHPGPLNRGVEIASDVADGPQSMILEQPKLGVAMRMAIMAGL